MLQASQPATVAGRSAFARGSARLRTAQRAPSVRVPRAAVAAKAVVSAPAKAGKVWHSRQVQPGCMAHYIFPGLPKSVLLSGRRSPARRRSPSTRTCTSAARSRTCVLRCT